MAKYKIGNVVKLKSGGPEMTVVNFDEKEKLVQCQWFEESHLIMEEFEEEILAMADKEE